MSSNLSPTLNAVIKNNGTFQSDAQYKHIVANVSTRVPQQFKQLCEFCSWIYEHEFKKEFGSALISKLVSTNYVYLGNDHGINYKLKTANKKEMESDELIAYNNDYYVVIWKRKSSDEFSSNVANANLELNKILDHLKGLRPKIKDLDSDLQSDIIRHVTADINNEIKTIMRDNNVSLSQIDSDIIKNIKLLY